MLRAPFRASAAADASDRARPMISCPDAMSSSVTAEPIQPVAPVMKTLDYGALIDLAIVELREVVMGPSRSPDRG